MATASNERGGEPPPPRRRIESGLGRAFDMLLNAFALVSGALLVAMMLATVLRVALRTVFNYGILGVDQVSGIFMVYCAFLGAAWVLRRDGHVTVDILVATLPPRARRFFEILASVIGAAACLTIAYFSVVAVQLSLQRGIVVAAELEIPRAVNLIAIPVGCFLLGIEFIRRGLRLYRGELGPRDVPRMEA
ncbi:TRAP transporter small permease subunit [Rhodoplanes serenus]|uniref:TRAP transporter small permease protein n=1 Tax=Rhodoplanes serenus TaxID=200615 RepID=A0A9X4XNX4_9BRAD|nr:TRAP transporter small permease [Rhodoplanes serenus]MTW18627.1 TRAP transporter small permease subunit [Rhodoplanes serenus]